MGKIPPERDHEAMNVVREIVDLANTFPPGRPLELTEAGKLVRAAIDKAVADVVGDTMTKLAVIEQAPDRTIYDIHYCNAGVGIMFYFPSKDPDREARKERESAAAKVSTEEYMRVCEENQGAYKVGLSVERYYPTFAKCIAAEHERLTATVEEVTS